MSLKQIQTPRYGAPFLLEITTNRQIVFMQTHAFGGQPFSRK